MKVYIEGQKLDDTVAELPLHSALVLFLVNYCGTPCFELCIVNSGGLEDIRIKQKMTELRNVSHRWLQSNVPERVSNCIFPVIEDEKEHMVRSGLCCTARHIIKVSSNHMISQEMPDTLTELLGFRTATLKACAEVSGWTKLCEVELPKVISQMIDTLRKSTLPANVEIPVDIMKLELHFDYPPLVHNDEKKKRVLLNDLQHEFDELSQMLKGDHLLSEGERSMAIRHFFSRREELMPHGKLFYRVLSMEERDSLNADIDKECKFGCTKDKLLKWCAKCNDRKKIKQKEHREQKNNARLAKQNGNYKTSTESVKLTGHAIFSTEHIAGIPTVDISTYTEGLTLNDIVYEHVYAEGVSFSLSDLVLFVYIYHLLESMLFRCTPFLEKVPNIHKWLKNIVSLPRIEQTSAVCGYNLAALRLAVNDNPTKLHQLSSCTFTIPQEIFKIDEEISTISRGSKGKLKALKEDMKQILDKVKVAHIIPEVGQHPCGEQIHVDWTAIPIAVHPRSELPEKRIDRKCEQLENLASVVQAIAKPGDIIVDFCSGGGHLGLLIAYLLPECIVYLVESKEESLVRAKSRILETQLVNVTLYQCNLDYFKGHFDIGVCLHACGVATDLVLHKCLDNNASFVICPCCYGSIQNTHLVTYPQSQCYKNGGITDKELIILGHGADQTEENTELYQQGRHCMNLVDTDRANLARDKGYNVILCSLKPLSCTPKNNLIIGSRSSSIYQEGT